MIFKIGLLHETLETCYIIYIEIQQNARFPQLKYAFIMESLC